MKDIAQKLMFMHPNLKNRKADGIHERTSVMHEVYAALSIITLQQQLGGRERLSEDEFYASYSEPPWHRWSRLIQTLFDRLKQTRRTEDVCTTGTSHACRLAKT